MSTDLPAAFGLPQVTIGVPVYNGERYLQTCLDHIAAQELRDFEVVVSDNGSTDRTRDICLQYAAKDSRFRYFRSDQNRGLSFNWNRCLQEARGAYFTWNAADDFAEPGHLRICVDALHNEPRAQAAFGLVGIVDDAGTPVGTFHDCRLDFLDASPSQRVAKYFEHQTYQLVGYGGVFVTESLRELDGIPRHWGGDFILATDFAMRHPFVQIQARTYSMRRHDGQGTSLLSKDPRDQVTSYDPNRRPILAFPQWEMTFKMIERTLRSPNSILERLSGVRYLLEFWTFRNKRALLSDIKRNFIHRFGVAKV